MERARVPGPVNPTRNSLEFDLSHESLKESSNELPLWVGNKRQEYYKKYKGNKEKKLEKFEYVDAVLTLGG